MKLTKITQVLILGTAFNTAPALAASTAEDFQTWGNITATGSLGIFNPNLQQIKYWLEGQGRFGNDTSVLSQGMARLGLGYAVTNEFSVWAGYAFIPTDEPFTTKAFDEHRIWQQALWSHQFDFGTVTSRSRLEQRFLDGDSDVAWRYRQLLKVAIPFSFAPDFSFVLTDEYFVHLNTTQRRVLDNGFDQNRVFAGIGYNFTKNIKTEVGYMNQYIRRYNNPDRMSNILSLNIYLNY
jgi:Protein of unknown function (DUF2490)